MGSSQVPCPRNNLANLFSQSGSIPLHYASCEGHVGTARLLLQEGADFYTANDVSAIYSRGVYLRLAYIDTISAFTLASILYSLSSLYRRERLQ